MSLRFNGTEITRVYFNGVERMALKFNGTGYFGKRFTLTKNTSTGVTLTVNRTSSPNQRASTGTVSTGNTIYYGDVITITCTASSGYTNPKLYVNTGSGMIARTSPYSFTVTGNVTFYGTATKADIWETVWNGSKIVTEMEDFVVPGLDALNGSVQLTAVTTFGQWVINQQTGQEVDYNTSTKSINRVQLPTTISGAYSSITFKRSGNKITFTVNANYESLKGYYIYESPIQTEFKEVRVKQ